MLYIIKFVVLTIILSIVIDMAASQPNKPTRKWDEDRDDEGERPGWWKEAARKVREKDAAEQARKEEEARLARIDDYHRGRIEVVEREARLIAKAKAQRKLAQQVFEEKWRKAQLVEKERREREEREFEKKVLHEARLAWDVDATEEDATKPEGSSRAREEEEGEEDSFKRKGKYPRSTQ